MYLFLELLVLSHTSLTSCCLLGCLLGCLANSYLVRTVTLKRKRHLHNIEQIRPQGVGGETANDCNFVHKDILSHRTVSSHKIMKECNCVFF